MKRTLSRFWSVAGSAAREDKGPDDRNASQVMANDSLPYRVSCGRIQIPLAYGLESMTFEAGLSLMVSRVREIPRRDRGRDHFLESIFSAGSLLKGTRSSRLTLAPGTVAMGCRSQPDVSA